MAARKSTRVNRKSKTKYGCSRNRNAAPSAQSQWGCGVLSQPDPGVECRVLAESCGR